MNRKSFRGLPAIYITALALNTIANFHLQPWGQYIHESNPLEVL